MKIIIDKGNQESQTPIITIDTKNCYYPYAIRNSLEIALQMDGFDKETINEIFGIMPDTKLCSNEQ